MNVQVLETCPHCFERVSVTLNHKPEPRARFEYLCPRCHEMQRGYFNESRTRERSLNTVMGVVSH